MHSEREREALRDILANIDLAREFTDSLSFTGFIADRRTLYATVRCLEIISEASRRLSPELKGRRNEIHWPAVAAVGNVYRHDYGKVDPAAVWDAVQNELAPLRAIMEAELS